MALAQLTDVIKVYSNGHRQVVLDSVSLCIEAGDFACLMGPSGSGKSTLLNLIAGLDRPTSGDLVVNGVNLGSLGQGGLARYRRLEVGLVFQFFNLLDLSVIDNVVLPARLSGTYGRHAYAAARELLKQLGIEDKAQQYPSTLSGGERQRVAVARAIINRPALLLADEPTGALDRASGQQVMDLLSALHKGGQTILMATHDLQLATTYATRLICVADGRITEEARP